MNNESPAPNPADRTAAAAETADAIEWPIGQGSAKKAWLITASYALSLAIFAWSITLSVSSTAETPPPASAVATRAAPPKADRLRPAEAHSGADRRVHAEPSEGDAYRAEALALDREFMRRRKRRADSPRRLPSHQEAFVRWQTQVDRLRQQLKDHADPEEGSIRWGQKKQLEALLADPPTATSPAD